MVKNILNLDGVQELSKKDQKHINGGGYMGHCTNTKPNPECIVTDDGCAPNTNDIDCICANGQILWWCPAI